MDMLGGPSGPFSFFDHLVQLKSFIWSTSDTFDLSLGCWSNCKFFQAWICLSSHITPSSTWSTWSSHRPNHRITPQLSVRLHSQQPEKTTKQIRSQENSMLGIWWGHHLIARGNRQFQYQAIHVIYIYLYYLQVLKETKRGWCGKLGFGKFGQTLEKWGAKYTGGGSRQWGEGQNNIVRHSFVGACHPTPPLSIDPPPTTSSCFWQLLAGARLEELLFISARYKSSVWPLPDRETAALEIRDGSNCCLISLRTTVFRNIRAWAENTLKKNQAWHSFHSWALGW